MRIKTLKDLDTIPLGEDITLIRYMKNNNLFAFDFIRLIIVKPSGKVYYNDFNAGNKFYLGCTSDKTQVKALINVYRYHTNGKLYRELALI